MSGNADRIWEIMDERGDFKFVQLPICLARSILEGDFKLNEIKVLLLICRMTFGFQSKGTDNKDSTKNETTNLLSLDDFQEYTGMGKTRLSEAIVSLVRRQRILKHSSNGGRWRYAINLLIYDIPMKEYVFSNDGNEFGEAGYAIRTEIYDLSNNKRTDFSLILYKPKTSKKT